MATGNEDLLIRIRADVKQALGEVQAVKDELHGIDSAGGSAGRGMDKTARGAERADQKLRRINQTTERTNSIFHDLRNVFVAAFAAHEVVDFTHSIVHANVEAQRIDYTLRSVTGSTQGAKREFQYLTNISKRLGLDLQTTAQGYARLAVSSKSAGISTRELHKNFRGLAETFTVLHTPAQDVNGLLVQLEQGLSLGKLQMQDFRAIAQHLPGTLEMAKQAVHDMGGSLAQMLANGGVPAKQFFEHFTALLHDKYGPEAKAASHSINSELNRLKTTLFQAETQGNSFADTFAQAIANLNKTLNDPGVQAGFKDLISGLGHVVSGAIKATSAVTKFFSEVGGGLGVAAAHIAGYTHDPLKQLNNEIDSTGQRVDSLKKKLAEIGNIRAITPKQQQGQDTRTKQLQNQIKMLEARQHALQRARESLKNNGGVNAPANLASSTHHASKASDAQVLGQSLNLGGFDPNSLKTQPVSSTGSNPTAGKTVAQQRVQSIHQIISALTQQRDAIGKTANEQKIAKLEELGASKATIDHAKAIQHTIAQQKADAAQKKQDAQAAKQAAQQRQQFINQIKSSIDPARQYRQELARLNKVYQNSDQLGPAQYAKAVAHLKDQIKNAGHQAQQTGGVLNQFGVSEARNIQSAIAQGLQFNKLNQGFKGLLHTAVSTFEQIAAQAAATNIADKLFGKGFASGKGNLGGYLGHIGTMFSGGGKGGGGFLGSFGSLFGGGGKSGGGIGGIVSTGASLLGSFLHEGGLVAPGAGRQQSVPLGAFAGAPRLHSGASIGLKSDEVPAVLQTGERVQSRAEVAATGKSQPQTHIHVWSMDQAAHELAKVPAFHEAIVHTVGDNPHTIQSTWNNG